MIAIIKYNAGNTRSVVNAITRLGYDSIVTDNPEEILKADKVILPGVGEASSAMQYLQEKNLDTIIKSLQQPFFGICLGLQLMCKHSEENDTACMGIFDAVVKKFPPDQIVPHMGWNNLIQPESSLFKGVNENDNVYFVHGYYAEVSKETIASCDYIRPFSAAMHHENFYATQFHPEKSGVTGEKILKNFLQL